MLGYSVILHIIISTSSGVSKSPFGSGDLVCNLSFPLPAVFTLVRKTVSCLSCILRSLDEEPGK